MPPAYGLRVIHSGIHGYGVITTKPFVQGETVMYGDGVLYRETEDFDDEYALILPGYELKGDGKEGPPMYYDLTDQTRWINHSCDPNTEVDTAWDPATKTARAWWVATRDIPVGEEIAYDYAFSAHLAIPCRCGMPACRGLIVDEDEIDQIPAEMKQHVRHPLATPAASTSPAAEQKAS